MESLSRWVAFAVQTIGPMHSLLLYMLTFFFFLYTDGEINVAEE